MAVDLLSRHRLGTEIVARVLPLCRIVEDGLAPLAFDAAQGKTVIDIVGKVDR
jgi:hypothetical protein